MTSSHLLPPAKNSFDEHLGGPLVYRPDRIDSTNTNAAIKRARPRTRGRFSVRNVFAPERAFVGQGLSHQWGLAEIPLPLGAAGYSLAERGENPTTPNKVE